MTIEPRSDLVADRPIADMQILIADDSRDSADLLAELIRLELGCQVATAYDGQQAAELSLSAHYDVLILDLQMPGLSGLEVASGVKSRVGHLKPPLLLAMTGRSDLADELAAVDVCFDRAFAKPIDYETLLGTLRTHWQGSSTTREAVEFRVFETLTQAAREMLPLMAAKSQRLSFDAEGPELLLFGDEVAVHSALYRLMCGAADLMESGIVMVAARSVAAECGLQLLIVSIAGNVLLDSPQRRDDVLQRLGLDIDTSSASQRDAGGFILARGVCPNSGGAVSFASHAREGVLLRLELSVRPVECEPLPRAERAQAWIVDERSVEPAVLERRLQRLGWRVWRFASLLDASRHIGASPDDCPNLFLVRDDPPASRSALAALQSCLPDRTRCVLLVSAGSAALAKPGTLLGWDLRVEPLSPGDLTQASLLALDAESGNGGPATVSHSLRSRRKVLVVDDNEVNRIIACGLLEVLGYEVAAVCDGLDAIEHCKHAPPDVVLMDINMPVLGGIDASRRIVELQKTGRIAPFAIIVATADDAHETKARSFEAGVRGYLCKPLRLELMRDELRRVGVPAAAV